MLPRTIIAVTISQYRRRALLPCLMLHTILGAAGPPPTEEAVNPAAGAAAEPRFSVREYRVLGNTVLPVVNLSAFLL